MKPLWIMLFVAPLAFGETPSPTMMRGAKLSQPTPPSMTIIVGANSVTGGVAAPGWPIIVSAAMLDDHPVPANLKVRMTDGNGQEVVISFERVKDYWIAGESVTKALQPGQYHISLVPAGDLRIESGDLLVGPADADALALLKIQAALLTGKDDEALAEAGRHPENVDAWIAKGDILLDQDLPDEALAAYDQALKLRDPEAGEDLPLMKRRRDAFFRSLEKRGVVPEKKRTP